MLNILLKTVGERALHSAIANGGRSNPLDVKFGVALLRDRRVPVKSKLLALGIGLGLLALLMAFELPIEAIVTFLAPFLLPVDFVLDGAELVALPLLFMALSLAYVAPRAIVDQIRAERGLVQGNTANMGSVTQQDDIIDVVSYETKTAPMPTIQTPLYAGSRRA